MKRRDFLKRSIATGAFAGIAFSLGGRKILAQAIEEPAYDLVAVKGGLPIAMFDKAIEVYGGIGKFVKSGNKVVVKPNIGWDATPERAANTNPELIGHIVKKCLAAGAKEVNVLDYTCDNWQKCYTNSGIEKAVKDAGGNMLPANSSQYYKDIEIPKGKTLKKAKVHEQILAADVFINVPVLKHHGSTDVSIGMKNLMGIVEDRRYYHLKGLHQCIADFTTAIKPDLTIVDAYRVMKKNGPRGVSVADVAEVKSLIMSTDPVAADAAAAKIFGSEPTSIKYINYAHEMGVGNKDLASLNIKRISL